MLQSRKRKEESWKMDERWKTYQIRLNEVHFYSCVSRPTHCPPTSPPFPLMFAELGHSGLIAIISAL